MIDSASKEERPVVLITGLSLRLGMAAGIALAMAKAGWNIGLTGWPAYDAEMPWGSDPLDLPQILDELEKLTPGGATYIEADLGDPAMPRAVFDRAENMLGPIAALVNVHTYSTYGVSSRSPRSSSIAIWLSMHAEYC